MWRSWSYRRELWSGRSSLLHLQATSACPNPKTNENKQCFNCGGTGHIQMECPSLKVSAGVPAAPGAKCFNCGRFGHLARNCFAPPASAGGAGRGASGPVRCYKCNGINHFARDCMAPAAVGGAGRGRGAGNGVPVAKKTCYKCHTEGHIAKDCPLLKELSA
ncbi:hypothetical protein BT69DRAFT_812266 [Atractiella rhizophila]|nr:hypothetical protein BT69DRAFT_812266 [Atractiella rhizophila]